jgi:hypothetical protein
MIFTLFKKVSCIDKTLPEIVESFEYARNSTYFSAGRKIEKWNEIIYNHPYERPHK